MCICSKTYMALDLKNLVIFTIARCQQLETLLVPETLPGVSYTVEKIALILKLV